MKQLLLVRHAKSSWDFPDWHDIDRPLNSRGVNAAYEMGLRHFPSLSKPEKIISSPANRALHTATILMRQWRLPLSSLKVDADIYEGYSENLEQVIQGNPKEINKLMLVGHNPGITSFVNRHQNTHRIDNVPTCGMALFKCDIEDWKEFSVHYIAQLGFFDYPNNPEQD